MMREEAAANYGAKYLARRSYLDRIASANANALVRAWNKMKRWIADVKAKDLTTARLMERYTQSIAKYVGTTYAVESTLATMVENKEPQSEERFSIQDGKVVVDTDRGIFDGIDRKDYGKTVRAYMREHFRGKMISDTVFTSISEGEYTSSKYTKGLYSANDGLYDAKMQASTELDNIVSSGKFIGHENAKHPHSYNGNGYDRFEFIFSIDGEDFIGEMLVAINNENKRTFYDIVRIKRDAFNRATDIADHDKHISDRSISQNSENVNRKSEKTRFELSEDRGYSKGQAAKIVANARKSKVYSKAEAEKAIDNVTALVSDLTSETNVLRKADIRGKSRAEVIDYLWERMNAAKKKDRLNVAPGRYKNAAAEMDSLLGIAHTGFTDVICHVGRFETRREESNSRN